MCRYILCPNEDGGNELGKGAYGTVYEAYDQHDNGKKIAIKVVKQVFSKHPLITKRLLREAKILRLLKGHPVKDRPFVFDINIQISQKN